MRKIIAGMLLTALAGCGDESFSLKLSPAVRADGQAPDGWRMVEYEGDQHSSAGLYHVRNEPLITEFNIIAVRTASQGTRRVAVVVLNEYATQRMQSYSADSANLKQPLALNVNGRWASFKPLLRTPSELNEPKADTRHSASAVHAL